MKVRPKSIKATIFIIAIAIIAMIAAKFFGFSSTRSATRIGYIGNEGPSSWSGSYIKLDGNARSIADRLKCSTRPVFTCYENM